MQVKFCIVGPVSKKTKVTFAGQDKVIAALFGAAGTNAVVPMIADEPRIYSVDLSMVVSKYVKETEKNLRKLRKKVGRFFSSTREMPSLAREQRSRTAMTGMQTSK